MIFKNKTLSVALSLMLFLTVAFGAAPDLQSASYDEAQNQLILVFAEDVQLDNVLLNLISIDDDNGGPAADLMIQNGSIVNPNSLATNDTVAIDLLYGDIIDSFTGTYRGDTENVFELWGTNVQQVRTLEAMNTSSLTAILAAGAFLSAGNELSPAQSASCALVADSGKPQITDAAYDAGTNTLSLVFDQVVQFDRIAEDRSENGGPGNGELQLPIGDDDPGEDRNGNGTLEYEANVQPFRIGLTGAAESMALEDIESIQQTMDNDSLDIVLTANDAKKLESKVGLSGLALNVDQWAFVDTDYNPNIASTMSVQTVADPVEFVADSVSYNASKNIMSIYFPKLAAAGRTVSLSPAPVYTKMAFTSANGSHTLNGVEGNPAHIIGFDETAFKFELQIPDQAGLEQLIDLGGAVTLEMESFALYDNFNNGNEDMAGVPVNVVYTTDVNEAPPVLTESNYDVETHIMVLTWNLRRGIGFYLGEELVEYEDAIVQDLSGIELYDPIADSTISLGEGMVYYDGKKTKTYIELATEDAIRLETYPNLDTLTTYLDRDVFNAFSKMNGNAAIGAADSVRLEITEDPTAPLVNSAQVNVFTNRLTLALNEPVALDGISLADFDLAGISLTGALVNEDEASYSMEVVIELDDAFFTAFDALADSIRIGPDLAISGGALTNISDLPVAVDTLTAGIGRTFFLESHEAFAPPPSSRFGALKLIGNDADIYVDSEMWDEGRVNTGILDSLITAFESSTPVDSTRGIKAIVDEIYGGVPDTDENPKLIFFLADVLDEYDLGRNDMNAAFFENGYVSALDTSDSYYSNQGDIIYIDVDPQVVGVAPFTEWNETMLHALTYQYTLLSTMHNKPDQERWINYGVALKMQEQTAGNIKFFGEAIGTAATSNNELTYIAQSLLKSRNDLYNVYNYFTYLTEKYPGTNSSFDIIKALAQTDVVGTAAVDSALMELGYSVSGAQAFQNYAVACFLDMYQESATDTNKYNGIYNFEALDLYGDPGSKNAGNLPWNTAENLGAPYPKAQVQPWSYNFYIARSYFIDIEGNFVVVSPDLSGSDTLVFDGYDGINFQASKILLHSGFLDPMTQDFEVVNFEIDEEGSRGMLPMTTDSNFEFRTTFPDTANGVQLLGLVVSKTDYAPPPPTYDFVISNVTTKPAFGDLYALQNPDADNFIDLFVVSERPIYNSLGTEGAVAEIISSEDTTMLDLALLDSYEGIVSIYSGKYTILEEGDYSFVFSGQDQNGISFDPVTQNISIGMAKPLAAMDMNLPNGLGRLSVPSNAVNSSRFIVASRRAASREVVSQFPDLPEGVQLVSDIISVGHEGVNLDRTAQLSLSFAAEYAAESSDLGVYLLREGEWQYVGGRINIESSTIQVETNHLGRFIIARGDHPVEDMMLPDVMTLDQNYPNPFNPSTTITFSLPNDASVNVKVFNMLGQEVASLADGYFQRGRHELVWNAHDADQRRIASGVYFYSIESGDLRLVKKMVVLK